MPQFPTKNLFLFQIRITSEERDELRHYARTLGRDMSDIIRDGLVSRLEFLRAKELEKLELKKLRRDQTPKTKRAVGLGKGWRVNPMVTNFTCPEKIRKSFRHYAEYLEQSPDPQSRELRTQTILEDIKERTKNSDEASASYEALQEFLKARDDSKSKPLGVVDVTKIPNVSGDV